MKFPLVLCVYMEYFILTCFFLGEVRVQLKPIYRLDNYRKLTQDVRSWGHAYYF